MTNTSPQKPQRKLTSLELSAPARGALRRLKKCFGMTHTHAVESGVLDLEKRLVRDAVLNGLEPLDDADRAGLGLKPAATVKPNRRKGAAR